MPLLFPHLFLMLCDIWDNPSLFRSRPPAVTVRHSQRAQDEDRERTLKRLQLRIALGLNLERNNEPRERETLAERFANNLNSPTSASSRALRLRLVAPQKHLHCRRRFVHRLRANDRDNRII